MTHTDPWEESLIVEVMEEYIKTIEVTHGMEYRERIKSRQACFEKLKSFIHQTITTALEAKAVEVESINENQTNLAMSKSFNEGIKAGIIRAKKEALTLIRKP